jgi:hypothetical protein
MKTKLIEFGELEEYFNMKQIGKLFCKVVYTPIYVCPICQNSDIRKSHVFCYCCGSKIDWSEFLQVDSLGIVSERYAKSMAEQLDKTMIGDPKLPKEKCSKCATKLGAIKNGAQLCPYCGNYERRR